MAVGQPEEEVAVDPRTCKMLRKHGQSGSSTCRHCRRKLDHGCFDNVAIPSLNPPFSPFIVDNPTPSETSYITR